MKKVMTVVISLFVGFVGAYTNDFAGANLRDLDTFIQFTVTSVVYTIIVGIGCWLWYFKSNEEGRKED